MIKDPKNEMVYQSVDGLRPMVEAGTGRNDMHACVSEPQHVFEMD
jgi:hypothetical protein